MNIYELTSELSKHSPQEIEFCLKMLMANDKINYVSLSNAYVSYLNDLKENDKIKLAEAQTCIIESFDRKKTTAFNKDNNNCKHTQRCLYLLNDLKAFKMDALNEKYNYDPEFAKTLSNLNED